LRLQAATALYDACHETLAETLVEMGVAAKLFRPPEAACQGSNADRDSNQPFLCFARRTCGDIVCRGVKIVGSAQRRSRGAVLQHGSILLDCSACAPELPGIAQLGHTIDAEDLANRWLERLAARLNVAFAPCQLSSNEIAVAESVAREKFAAEAFTMRR
jgi:lipoate-protein ligase A